MPKSSPLAFFISLALCSAQTFANQTKSHDKQDMEHIEVKRLWQPYRGNVPIAKTPQAIDSVTAETLENEGITQLMAALELSASIVRQNNSGGMFDSFAIRGFSGDENNPTGYLVNGFNSRGYNGNRSTANIDVIEVMKGPGSALYGQGEPGGTINIITKKPQFDRQGYLQATLGNYNLKQVEFDYTDGLNEELAYRVNGAYKDSDSYRDHVFEQSLHVNPSLLWQISDTTNLSYELEVLDQEKPLDRGIYVLNNDFDATSPNQFYGDKRDGGHNVSALGHQLLFNHKINEQWHVLTGVAYRDSSFEGTSADTELSSGRQLLYSDPNILSRQKRSRDYQAQDLSIRLELSGEVAIGSINNNLLLGVDSYQFDLDTDYKVWRTAWGAGDTTYSINPNMPEHNQTQPQPLPKTHTEETQQGLGFYAQDLIELTDKTQLLLGVRVDKFKQDILNKLSQQSQNKQQTEVTPRFGLLYELNDKINLYTSYAEGFRPNPGLDSDRNAFAPEQTTSYEVGAKWQNILQRLSGSVAIYSAEKTNMLTAEPNTGLSATLGKVKSQGLDLNVNVNVSPDTQLEFAYAFTDAKTANDVINSDWGVPIAKGSRLINIAKNIAHIALMHSTNVADKDTFLRATVHYVGDRLGETTDADYILPAYTLVNLSAAVTLTEQLSLKLDINNALDEVYFENSYHKLWTMPGAPINYSASVKYQF